MFSSLYCLNHVIARRIVDALVVIFVALVVSLRCIFCCCVLIVDTLVVLSLLLSCCNCRCSCCIVDALVTLPPFSLHHCVICSLIPSSLLLMLLLRCLIYRRSVAIGAITIVNGVKFLTLLLRRCHSNTIVVSIFASLQTSMLSSFCRCCHVVAAVFVSSLPLSLRPFLVVVGVVVLLSSMSWWSSLL
jgi:hypothetical protein